MAFFLCVKSCICEWAGGGGKCQRRFLIPVPHWYEHSWTHRRSKCVPYQFLSVVDNDEMSPALQAVRAARVPAPPRSGDVVAAVAQHLPGCVTACWPVCFTQHHRNIAQRKHTTLAPQRNPCHWAKDRTAWHNNNHTPDPAGKSRVFEYFMSCQAIFTFCQN